MKPKETKIEGFYNWVDDPLRIREKISHPTCLYEFDGGHSTLQRTILWINGRPYTLKEGRRF